MNSQATSQFWKLYAGLPEQIQQTAVKAYQLWQDNPRHPSVQFKKVKDDGPIYSARVNDSYRALCVLVDGTAVWFWIGNHDAYERMLK